MKFFTTLLVLLAFLAGGQVSARTCPSRPALDMSTYEEDTIVIATSACRLYYKTSFGVLVFKVGVGRDGFRWSGTATVGKKQERPDWIPPPEMRQREPWLPERVKGGDPQNPLGERALYLYQGEKDTLYRIHGTREPSTVGLMLSSGCIRMLNGDVKYLYTMVRVGTKVVVLP